VSPDEMSERLAAWARVLWGDGRWVRRVVCVEPEGPRRTFLLFTGGRQVGHVRGRCAEAEAWDRGLREAERQGWTSAHRCGVDELRFRERVMPWTWEAANAGREVLDG
jgi:hypothetical protein